MALALLVLAGIVAVGDWFAVWQRRPRLERLLKPLTLGLLIGAGIAADVGTLKPWVLAALALCLLGDVALLLSSDEPGPPDLGFLLGLGAFLLGHIAYVVAFLQHGVRGAPLVAGVLLVGGSAASVLPAVFAGARRAGGWALLLPVAGYAGALTLMSILGVGTGLFATALGALLFLGSDSTLAFERFVRPVRYGALRVIVSYHLAQALILIGLVRQW